jgi:hypothetical protein
MYFSLSLSCCSHLEHTVSARPFVSLQFLNPNTVGRTPWTGDQPDSRPLPTHQISIPCVRFEPTIRAFERAKTVRALDLAVTVIDIYTYHYTLNNLFQSHFVFKMLPDRHVYCETVRKKSCLLGRTSTFTYIR